MRNLTHAKMLEAAILNPEDVKYELWNVYLAWLEHLQNRPEGEDLGEFLEETLRFDTGTGLPMTRGWVFMDGDYCISDEDRAEAFCQNLWGQTLEEAHAEDEDCVYYTEWC